MTSMVLLYPVKLCYDSVFGLSYRDKHILQIAFEFVGTYVEIRDDPGTAMAQLVDLVGSNLITFERISESCRTGETLDIV